ncbi:MAG: insulinase family protein [Ignavibacteria bacterium]|nr:insulinase family protein [Ignavibacteria bacterium]
MKQKFLIYFVLTFFTVLNAQERKIEFTEFDLSNGLHVILHQDNSTPIVAVSVAYHVGSKNEDAKRTGFAHFFEHLMFTGTENIKIGELDKLLENAGAANNAYTTQDVTYYYDILPSNQLELGLWMESERMLHLKIDSNSVETQRKVVKEERSSRYDNKPYGSLWETVFKNAYKKHPYRWTPIGSVQYIDKATIEEFREFYKKYYVPENAVLVVAGDINIDEAKELVQKYFSDISRGKETIKRPDITEPSLAYTVRDTVYDNIQLPLVLYAYRIPEQKSDEMYKLNMLSDLLTDGESSRLRKVLVDEKKLAIEVSSFLYSLEDPGLFVIYALANYGVSVNDIKYALNKEIEKVKSEMIDEYEFTKLRNNVESQVVSSNSTMEGIAEELAMNYIFHNNTNLINKQLEKYMKVTREDILNCAKQYLPENGRVQIIYLPKSKMNTQN